MSLRRRRARGFTLVEVMVSLVISSLLVGMVLAVFSRMTLAYRGQQGVAELQQILSAAQSMIERDLRQAGHQMPDGYFIANDAFLHQPVEILNDPYGFGPDEIHIFYADASAQARVRTTALNTDPNVAFTEIPVDDAGDFVPGDVVVMVKGSKSTEPEDTRFYACVVQIEAIPNSQMLSLDGAGRWGTPLNKQCDQLRRTDSGIVDAFAMVYKFRARGYRIDPNRRELAVLQMSPTGGYEDDWQDLAVGFTDMQIASRWNDTLDPDAGADTNDLDADGSHEWYSGITQQGLTGLLAVMSGDPADHYQMDEYDLTRSRLAQVRVSLVVRTHSKLDVVPSLRTPKLVDDARPANNDTGDRDSVQLEGVADIARPVELRGNHIYRYATVGADLRNMGVAL
jgi:prepilin-type N-terminal cleavage/methylation domain-containing protein